MLLHPSWFITFKCQLDSSKDCVDIDNNDCSDQEDTAKPFTAFIITYEAKEFPIIPHTFVNCKRYS